MRVIRWLVGDSSFTVTVTLHNGSAGRIVAWIEPWAESFVLDAQEQIDVTFDAKHAGKPEVIYGEGTISIYGFCGSRAVVQRPGADPWIAHQRLAE